MRHKRLAAAVHSDPVLFVHGSSFPSALAFDFQMEGMSWMDQLASKGFDVFALDLLGYGLSDRYPEMQGSSRVPVGRAREVVRDVASAVEHILRVTGRQKVIVIGHSWGGSVAALYASQYPAKVSKLVMFAGITARAESGRPVSPDAAYEEMSPSERIASMARLVPATEPPQLAPEVMLRWGDAWLASDRIGFHHGVGRVRFPSGPSQDVADLKHGRPYYDPSAIQAPTLLIRGQWDAYPDNDDFTALLAQLTRAKGSKYIVVAQGTHVMHLERARHALYDAVLEFLEGAAARPKI
jgi:pimeloyl-ACP methyl ester carboxylesterase